MPPVRKLLESTADDKAIKLDAETRFMRMRLWHALNNLVTKSGGHITSIPGMKRVRFQMPEGSDLPDKLSELGYVVEYRCTELRCTGTGATGLAQVMVFEITLPR